MQTDRQRDRERGRQTHRQRQRERDRERGRQIDREHTKGERQGERQTDRQRQRERAEVEHYYIQRDRLEMEGGDKFEQRTRKDCSASRQHKDRQTNEQSKRQPDRMR